MSDATEAAIRILEGFAEARANEAEAAWYGFVDPDDVELVAKFLVDER